MNTYISSLPNANTGYLVNSILCKKQPLLIFADPGSAEYKSISCHVAKVFKKAYGANVEVTYPLLMGFVDSDENPLAALGIRRAFKDSQLFLEQYLDQPVELCLQYITGQKIERKNIAEAGNLASTGKNDIVMLLYALACYLDEIGVSHIIFTGTSYLKRYLHSLGLYPHILAEADPMRVGQDISNWGTYYETLPKVMAGTVLDFRRGLELYFSDAGMNI